MTNTLEQLNAENENLREIIVSLSAILLQNAALQIVEKTDTEDTQHLLRQAEECFRCAHLAGMKPEIAEGLQAAGHELMARAVALDTQKQRAEKSSK